MQADRRALYNSLRMNWLLDTNLSVEPWQVEDYRTLSQEEIFARLNLHDLSLDKTSFLALSDQFDNPEDLTGHLLVDRDDDAVTQDQVYLLVFELWRRLLPEKPCISIFCDELDHQIFMYDSGRIENTESIQDAIANLAVVLDENADQGNEPEVVFETICAGCANDLESFLYDFISEQIEEGNHTYATELLDDFSDYVQDVKWFEFLRAKLVGAHDEEGANQLVHEMIHDVTSEPDFEYYIEVLAYMVQAGQEADFLYLVRKTVPLLECEEDFQDLLTICADFYHRLDQEGVEAAIQAILQKRAKNSFETVIDFKDPDIAELFKVMEASPL
jgi:hypothetical protein